MKRRSIRRFFPQKSFETPLEKGHGRIERRKITVLPAAAANLGADGAMPKWKSVAQIIKIERQRDEVRGGIIVKKKHEICYFITSLCPNAATPERLLTLQRDHWAIENNLHRNKDVLMGEDAITARKDNAATNRAALNAFVLAVYNTINPSPTKAKEYMQQNKTKFLNGKIKLFH